MFSAQESIGIELRENEMAIVHLRKRGERLRLKNFAFVKLGPADQGETRAADARAAMAIKEFVARHGIAQAAVVVGIPRKWAIFRFVDFPQLAAENLDKAVKYELERHLPFPIAETYYDYQKIRDEGSICKYLIVAAKRELIERHLEMVRGAGLSPGAVDITTFGTFNSYVCSSGDKGGEFSALLNLCGHEIELSLVAGKRFLYSRSTELKEGEAVIDRLRRELEISLMTLNRSAENLKIDRINLSGSDGLPLKDLAISIELGCGCETSLADLSDAVDFKPKEVKLEDWPKLYTAFGLALSGFGNGQLNFNLLGTVERKRESGNGTVATIILLIIALMLGSGLLGSRMYRQKYALDALNKEIDGLKQEVFATTDIQKEVESLQAQLASFDKLRARETSKLDILKQLTQILPQNAWIEKLTYEKNKVEINGYAESASALIPLLEASPLFENVEFTSTIIKKDSKEQFRIKLDIEG